MKIKYPSGNVLARNLERAYPVVTRGLRHKLWDQEGREYIDAVSGMLVVSMGHGHPEISARLAEAAGKLDYVNGMHFATEATEQLAAELVKRAKPIGLDRATFLASGSEATEAALKMARQIWFDRGKPNKSKFIARTPGYHGNTLFGLSVSARPHYKRVYGPLMHPVTFVDAPYPYRSKVDYQREGAAYYAGLVEKAILAAGPENVAAFLFEPVVGSSAGASVPPPGYMNLVQEICARHDVLIIADEVMCGAHRAGGNFFASAELGLRPDILTLGKGIGAGYFPLSAVLTKQEHVDAMKGGSGGFAHAQTFMMHPLASVVGAAVLQAMEKEKVSENVRSLSSRLIFGIQNALSEHPHVGSVQGSGFMLGIEFVADRASKRPFDRKHKVAEAMLTHALENGVTLWPNVGHADGVSGDLVMVGPPLNSTAAEVDEVVARVCDVVRSYRWPAERG